MKLAKLSLAAIVVAGLATSSFAADTLADAFAKGKVQGELRAWYFDRDRPANDADIINTGLVLNYVTDTFYGFYMGATFQSNYAPWADKDAKNMFAADQYGSGAVLSEAYLGYKMKNTDIKIGRQFISTPLVNGSGSRMIKQSFQGVTVVNTDIPNTTLVAGYVNKFQGRTDGQGNVADFEKLANDEDAYTVLVVNKSIAGLTLTGQWVQLTDTFNDYYVEAAYAGKAASFTYGLAANYLATDYDASGVDTGQMYGVKASFGIENFNAYVAYSQITDDNAVVAGLGSGAQPNFVKGYQFTTGTYTRDTKGYSIDANYNFKNIGLLLGARYTDLDVDSSTIDDRSYTDIYAVYNFSGALKGLSFDASYSDMGKDVDGSDFWFKANYKF